MQVNSLLVAVAVRTAEGVHQIAEHLIVGDPAKGNHVRELHGITRRAVYTSYTKSYSIIGNKSLISKVLAISLYYKT
jgi:hypothetical protein